MSALLVREAIVTAMKATNPLTALIPAGSMYGERVPATRTFPFTKMGDPILTPFRMACHNGEQDDFAIHWFIKASDTVAGNDEAVEFGNLLKDAFDQKSLPLEGGDTRDVEWTGGQVFADRDEKDTWHGFATFRVA